MSLIGSRSFLQFLVPGRKSECYSSQSLTERTRGKIYSPNLRFRTGLRKLLAVSLIGREECRRYVSAFENPPALLTTSIKTNRTCRSGTPRKAKRRSFSHQVAWIIKRSGVYLAWEGSAPHSPLRSRGFFSVDATGLEIPAAPGRVTLIGIGGRRAVMVQQTNSICPFRYSRGVQPGKGSSLAHAPCFIGTRGRSPWTTNLHCSPRW